MVEFVGHRDNLTCSGQISCALSEFGVKKTKTGFAELASIGQISCASSKFGAKKEID